MPAPKVPFRRVQTGTLEGELLQRSAQQTTRVLRVCPFMAQDGVWLRNVTVGTGSTTINHGLGRKPQGWIVTRCQSNAAFPVEAASQPADLTKQINLLAGATAIFDFWFF